MSGNCLLGLPKTAGGGDEIHFWSNTYGLHVPAFLKIKKGDPKANPNWMVTTPENKRHWEMLMYCGKTLTFWKGSPQYSAKQRSIICSQMTYLTVAGRERWVLRNLKSQRELLLIKQHDKKIKHVWNYIWSMGKLGAIYTNFSYIQLSSHTAITCGWYVHVLTSSYLSALLQPSPPWRRS